MVTYIIKSGDTLSAIAKKYGVSVSAIQKANPSLIKNVNKISVGWKISIPVSDGSESNSKAFEELGRAVSDCIEDIQKLPSYKKLMTLL